MVGSWVCNYLKEEGENTDMADPDRNKIIMVHLHLYFGNEVQI